MKQIDALNRQTADMQKSADLQRQDFEKEIEKLRRDQAELMRHLKSQPLEGTPRPSASHDRGMDSLNVSKSADTFSSNINVQIFKKGPSSDADDENLQADPKHPPGLTPGGPPDDPSDSDQGRRGRRDRKDRKKRFSTTQKT